MVKDVNSQILSDGVEVRRRWAEYFEQALPTLGDLNGRAISLVEVREAVNEIKSGKAPGLDGFPLVCLKKGGMASLEWLVRQLNVSFDIWVVPMHRRGACIMPMYTGKGDKCERSNSRGISLLSSR